MAIDKLDFEYVSNLARDQAAIVLEAGKEYLVESRLEPLARSSGFDSIGTLVSSMRGKPSTSDIHSQVIEALTTNETLFFRDFHPFEALKKALVPEIVARRSRERRIDIWSAASSSGQEAYSIAMLFRETFPELSGWSINILGTDLNTAIVRRASSGLYSQLEVNRGLPLPLLAKYFTEVDGNWQISEEIRRMVDFRPMNLVRSWPQLPVFDIVLVRNVMIYFDVPTKQQILKKIRQAMHSEGVLFLGASETTINIDSNWNVQSLGKSVVYRPKATPAFGLN